MGKEVEVVLRSANRRFFRGAKGDYPSIFMNLNCQKVFHHELHFEEFTGMVSSDDGCVGHLLCANDSGSNNSPRPINE